MYYPHTDLTNLTKNASLHRTGRVKQYPIGIATRKPYEVLEEIKRQRNQRENANVHIALDNQLIFT